LQASMSTPNCFLHNLRAQPQIRCLIAFVSRGTRLPVSYGTFNELQYYVRDILDRGMFFLYDDFHCCNINLPVQVTAMLH